MTGDLAVLFAWDHRNVATAVLSRDRSGVDFVAVRFELNSQKIKSVAHGAANLCAVLANSSSEDKQV